MATRKVLYDTQFVRHSHRRVLVFFVLGVFLLIISRFFYIQIIKGGYFFMLSMENMMREKVIRAPRGIIYDRNGLVMVRNRPSFVVSLLYHQVKDRKGLIQNLLKIRDRDGGAVFTRPELNKQFYVAARRRFEPVRLADDVSMDVATVVQEHLRDLPGIIVEREMRREYPDGTSACHALGYLGELPEEQFDSLKQFGYRFGDRIGMFGIEKQYQERYLRGRDGLEYVMYDAYGREIERVKGMPMVEARKGRDLYLTIDMTLQRVAEQAFPETLSGALVALDPRNGEILSMVSSPRFDPNAFTLSIKKRTSVWGKLAMDPAQPLNNRAVTGVYPPGSTFKLVTASAGLNEHIVGLDERFKPCHGSFFFGSRPFKCWRPQGHGSVGMVQGVKVSCDVYFYQVGIKTGIDYMVQYARMFGFAKKTGVDLPQEAAGEVLDEDFYNRKFKSRGWIWTKGQELNFAIGQGQIVTPIQLAAYAGAMAQGHVVYRPRLFLYSPDYDGRKEYRTPDTSNVLELKEQTRTMLKEALKAVMEPGGTGGWARVAGVNVGGKTGTAQNPQGNDHALFVAVAPLEDPRIAIAVVVENAGHGGSVAAPIAGKVLNAFFKPAEDEKTVKTEILDE